MPMPALSLQLVLFFSTKDVCLFPKSLSFDSTLYLIAEQEICSHYAFYHRFYGKIKALNGFNNLGMLLGMSQIPQRIFYQFFSDVTPRSDLQV